MTLEQVATELRRMRDDAYSWDSWVRRDPLYRNVNKLLQQVQAALPQSQEE